MVCPPGPPVYMDSRTAARAPRPGRPLGRVALGAPRGPSNRPPRHRGRLVQPRAAPPVPVQSGSADRPQSCVGLGHPLPMAVVGSLRHVGTAGGEPFFLPDSPVKPPPKKKLRNQPSRRKIALSDMAPPPSHPPPDFATSASSTSAPAASPQPPRTYGTLPLTRDAPQTSHRITPYHGSRVN